MQKRCRLIRYAHFVMVWCALQLLSVQCFAAPRIGEVWVESEAGAAPFHKALLEGLRGLGYTEGRNLELFTRYADRDESRLPSLLSELLALHVDVLFVSEAA